MTDALFETTESMFGDDRVDALVRRLHALPGWPADQAKDRALIADLMVKHPGKDLGREIDRWVTYEQSKRKPTGKEANYRARVRTWCRNGDRFSEQARLRPTRRGNPRSSVGGTPTAPRTLSGSGYQSW